MLKKIVIILSLAMAIMLFTIGCQRENYKPLGGQYLPQTIIVIDTRTGKPLYEFTDFDSVWRRWKRIITWEL